MLHDLQDKIAEEEDVRANARIDSLLKSHILDNLTHVPLTHELPTMPSPILSLKMEVPPSPKKGEHLDDVALNSNNHGKDIVIASKHLLLATLRLLDLESLCRMLQIKEMEDLLQCFV